MIGGAIVRIAVGTDAATLQMLRARRCHKLTACVISCGSCSRNSVGVWRSSIPSNARHMRRQCAPARIAFYLRDQTGQQVVRRNLNIQSALGIPRRVRDFGCSSQGCRISVVERPRTPWQSWVRFPPPAPRALDLKSGRRWIGIGLRPGRPSGIFSSGK